MMLDTGILLVELARIKAQEATLAARKTAIEADLVRELSLQKKATVSVVLVNGETLKGTLVSPQRVSYDADRLRGALSKVQWVKVTTAALDKVKLEAAVVAQVVDAQVVADCATITDTKPYVRVSGAYDANSAIPTPISTRKVVRRKGVAGR